MGVGNGRAPLHAGGSFTLFVYLLWMNHTTQCGTAEGLRSLVMAIAARLMANLYC